MSSLQLKGDLRYLTGSSLDVPWIAGCLLGGSGTLGIRLTARREQLALEKSTT